MSIKEALMKHLLQYIHIIHRQHDFLSTSTQLFECCADWNVAVNTRNDIDIVYKSRTIVQDQFL